LRWAWASFVAPPATAPWRVTAQLPSPPLQPVANELLKQVKALALDTLNNTLAVATIKAIFFMIDPRYPSVE
jgi:hypothetical protein